MGPNGIEAVGNGTLSAKMEGESECEAWIEINEQKTESLQVQDGDKIEVSLKTYQDCSCCEVGRNCNVKNAGFWVVKNNREKGVTSLDRRQLDRRLKALALRMASRKNKLRG